MARAIASIALLLLAIASIIAVILLIREGIRLKQERDLIYEILQKLTEKNEDDV